MSDVEFEVSTIRVSGWINLIPPAHAGGTDCALYGSFGPFSLSSLQLGSKPILHAPQALQIEPE